MGYNVKQIGKQEIMIWRMFFNYCKPTDFEYRSAM